MSVKITTDSSDWATNCPEYEVTAVQVEKVPSPSAWQTRYKSSVNNKESILNVHLKNKKHNRKLNLILDDESTLHPSFQSLPVHYWQQAGDKQQEKLDNIAEEVAIALVYNDIFHAVVMASPAYLHEFSIGFSLSEGIINNISEVYDIEFVTNEKGIEVRIEINSQCMMYLKPQRRSLTGRTGCVLCGSESLEQAVRPVKSVTPLMDPLPKQFGMRCLSQVSIKNYNH